MTTHITNITINNNCPTMGFGMTPMARPPMFGSSIFSNCFMPANNSMAAGYCVGTAISNPFIFKAIAYPFKMLGKGAAWTYNKAIKPAANFVWNKALKPAGNFVWNKVLKPFGQWVGGLFSKKS
jgi:hypothetical protein